MRRLLTAAAVATVFAVVAPASATVTDGLYLSMDARVPDSYSVSNLGQWNDVSPNGRDGTIYGNITLDAPTESLIFDGTGFGTNYVDLDGAFDDFDSGLTIEFIGEFGAESNVWERIFDFGNGDASDNVWVGRLEGTQELAFEVWLGASNQGRCHTTTGELASRELAHWVITIDDSLICRIFKDGVPQSTQLQNGMGVAIGSPTLDGTAYPAFPRNIERANNYVGRSNWSADPDFEGSIQMIRIYNRGLTESEVVDNTTSAENPTGGGGDNGGGEENSGGGDNTDSEPRSLADTGFDPITGATIAALMLGAGVFLLRRRARRN
jgi:hypothetical protein